ncbi:MAG: AAA family ATPase [Syntrophobacterales bacterium]|jgi:general secretion pathway protein A
MYLDHWDMNILPFENTPNPSFFYPSSMHKEALERLNYTVAQGKGAAMVVGGVGCGKTIISHALINRLRKDRYRVVAMTNPAFEPTEFLEMVMRLFRVPNGYDRSKAEMLDCLEGHLKKNMVEAKGSVLIVDEAQVIHNQRTLEELRMLLNLQAQNKFLVILILLGQLELSEKVAKVAPLDQRISVRYKLTPLPYKDSLYYIKHRLTVAGCKKMPFTAEALEAIFKLTKGIPREINNLCDRALLATYLADRTIATHEIVEEAWKDLR